MKRSIHVNLVWTKGLLAAAVACLLVFSGAMAWATPIFFGLQGVTFPDTVKATMVLDYEYLIADAVGELSVTLTNNCLCLQRAGRDRNGQGVHRGFRLDHVSA